jgi:biotin operon repressor
MKFIKVTHQQRIINKLSKTKYQTIRSLSTLLKTKQNAVRARVAELRKEGLNIETITTKTGKTAYQFAKLAA